MCAVFNDTSVATKSTRVPDAAERNFVSKRQISSIASIANTGVLTRGILHLLTRSDRASHKVSQDRTVASSPAHFEIMVDNKTAASLTVRGPFRCVSRLGTCLREA